MPCLDMALGYSISLEKSRSHDDLFFMHVGYVGYENVGYVSYVMYTCMFRGTPFFRAAYPYPAIY